MIKSKADLKRYLKLEEGIYREGMSKAKWKLLLLVPFTVHERATLYKYITLLRRTEYYSNTGKRILAMVYKFRLRRIQYKFGIMLPENVFQEGLRIQHLAQTRVSVHTKVGRNCTIYPFCSVGTNKGKSPIIGNNVQIFSGARIVGDVTLSDNISVATNAVVNKSCDIEGAVLAGVPAKVIKRP